ncbi:Flp pilus assembly protein CpaB [Marinicauda salina]|uniref:Flp pilus assembly protein CpaB n=1 Tax=Marinicauda salina TaxID=2135793 RepID=A0A2U2BX50_9PROT|nr:Flp pilus assembly protein CpaB [Marinicauda salina]PWE18598.1 Flp pilus assembly protein CpaB [Marinicauda salina]
MRNASIIMLIVAAVLGVAAVIGVRALLTGAGQQPAQQAEQASERRDMSTVVVARRPMEFGTEITPEMLREIPWAATERPEGSFRDVNEILTGERRVALRAIAPGEVVLADRISGFGGRAALSEVIADGKRAISLRINDVTGAAGFILPSDYVDVLLTTNPGRDAQTAVTDVILQNVRVLAIDQIADESQGGAVVAKAATLEVEIEDAQRIALASTVGTISLALRNVMNAAEGEAERVRTIRYSDLGPSQQASEDGDEESDEGEGQTAPARVVRAAPRPSRYTSMIITRGLVSEQERVIRDRPVSLAETDPSALAGGAP